MRLEVLSREPTSAPHPTPLLFVHGGNYGAWYWTNFLGYFADHGYAAYAPNLRGHGASEGRDRLNWTRIRDFVQDVAQIVADLSRPPVVIGHSMGGLIVQKYLETRPASAGILLASVPPAGGLAPILRLARQYPRATLRTLLEAAPHPFVNNPNLTREGFFSRV